MRPSISSTHWLRCANKSIVVRPSSSSLTAAPLTRLQISPRSSPQPTHECAYSATPPAVPRTRSISASPPLMGSLSLAWTLTAFTRSPTSLMEFVASSGAGSSGLAARRFRWAEAVGRAASPSPLVRRLGSGAPPFARCRRARSRSTPASPVSGGASACSHLVAGMRDGLSTRMASWPPASGTRAAGSCACPRWPRPMCQGILSPRYDDSTGAMGSTRLRPADATPPACEGHTYSPRASS